MSHCCRQAALVWLQGYSTDEEEDSGEDGEDLPIKNFPVSLCTPSRKYLSYSITWHIHLPNKALLHVACTDVALLTTSVLHH